MQLTMPVPDVFTLTEEHLRQEAQATVREQLLQVREDIHQEEHPLLPVLI